MEICVYSTTMLILVFFKKILIILKQFNTKIKYVNESTSFFDESYKVSEYTNYTFATGYLTLIEHRAYSLMNKLYFSKKDMVVEKDHNVKGLYKKRGVKTEYFKNFTTIKLGKYIEYLESEQRY